MEDERMDALEQRVDTIGNRLEELVGVVTETLDRLVPTESDEDSDETSEDTDTEDVSDDVTDDVEDDTSDDTSEDSDSDSTDEDVEQDSEESSDSEDETQESEEDETTDDVPNDTEESIEDEPEEPSLMELLAEASALEAVLGDSPSVQASIDRLKGRSVESLKDLVSDLKERLERKGQAATPPAPVDTEETANSDLLRLREQASSVMASTPSIKQEGKKRVLEIDGNKAELEEDEDEGTVEVLYRKKK